MRGAVGAVVLATAGAAVAFGAAGTGTTSSVAPSSQQIARACGGAVEGLLAGAPARRVMGSVPATVLAPYAVLRQPKGDTDVPPPPDNAMSLAGVLAGGLRSYDPNATRLVATFGSTSVYLLAGVARRLTVPAKCRKVLPSVAAIVEAETIELGRGPAYCLLTVSPESASETGGSGGAAGHDYTGVRCLGFAVTPEFVDDATVLPNAAQQNLDLVPDGVGAVQIDVPYMASPIVIPAANDIATAPQVQVPARLTAQLKSALHEPAKLRRLVNELLPTSVSWLTAPGGAVVRAFARPPGLLAGTVADLLASEQLVSDTSGGSGSTTTVCTGSGGPGRPTQQRCTSSKTG